MPRSARARSWGSTVKHQLIQDRQASPGTGHHEQPWRCRSDLLEIKATLRIAGRGPAMGPRAPGASRPTRTPPHPTRRTLCGVDPSMFRRQAVNPPSTALRTAGVGAWPGYRMPQPSPTCPTAPQTRAVGSRTGIAAGHHSCRWASDHCADPLGCTAGRPCWTLISVGHRHRLMDSSRVCTNSTTGWLSGTCSLGVHRRRRVGGCYLDVTRLLARVSR